MKLTVKQAIEKAYNKANLNSEDDDCIYKAIYSYKILRELEQKEIDSIYEDISKRLGFMEYQFKRGVCKI